MIGHALTVAHVLARAHDWPVPHGRQVLLRLCFSYGYGPGKGSGGHLCQGLLPKPLLPLEFLPFLLTVIRTGKSVVAHALSHLLLSFIERVTVFPSSQTSRSSGLQRDLAMACFLKLLLCCVFLPFFLNVRKTDKSVIVRRSVQCNVLIMPSATQWSALLLLVTCSMFGRSFAQLR